MIQFQEKNHLYQWSSNCVPRHFGVPWENLKSAAKIFWKNRIIKFFLKFGWFSHTKAVLYYLFTKICSYFTLISSKTSYCKGFKYLFQPFGIFGCAIKKFLTSSVCREQKSLMTTDLYKLRFFCSFDLIIDLQIKLLQFSFFLQKKERKWYKNYWNFQWIRTWSLYE